MHHESTSKEALTKDAITKIFDRLGTPPKGRKLVLDARIQAPVREVKSRGGNVITIFASRKMSCEIRTESRHIEFAAAVNHEYDPTVLEFYAQPCQLNLELFDAAGELHAIHHIPDFLVLREDGITLEEWKSDAKLARLAEKTPYRYEKGSDGQWFAPQIERQLAELGIGYRIYTDQSLPRARVENYLHLADYLHPGAEPCDAQTLQRLKAALAEDGFLFLADLLVPPYSLSADDLFKAIADREIVSDLDHELLSEPRRCRIYRDAITRDFMRATVSAGRVPGQERFVLDISEGSIFEYDGKRLSILLAGAEKVICAQDDGKTVELSRDWLLNAYEKGQITSSGAAEPGLLDLARYTEDDLKAALKRQEILRSTGSKTEASDRTKRRWKARQKVANVNGAHEVLALVPHTSARGNRTKRLTPEQQDIMRAVIDQHWRSHEAINAQACHLMLTNACNTASVKVPSYKTLRKWLAALTSKQDMRTRHGKRMAYQMSEFVEVLYHDTPQHGSRPFQYVHIDHTQVDIELISSRTEKPLGRPWLSLALDAWSRRVLAFYLTFDPPSYRSVMMIMRDLVRRHGRLPEFIVVDNGRDFMSAAFETFLQVMGVHLRFRPAGQPRHGAVLERIFGRVHSEYIHNLAGNTKAMKNVRMTTGKHLPVNFASWTLENLYHGIEYWATQYYDQECHVALDCSPREAFMRGLRDSGSRPQRHIFYGQEFLIATCPPVDREGVRKVDYQRGVKVNGFFYWNSEFRTPQMMEQRLPVRYDPWDASSVYVRFKDRWIHAICRNLAALGWLTELERRALTEEYVSRHGAVDEDGRSAQRLSEFMRTFSPGQAELLFDRQHENKMLSARLGMSSIQEAKPRVEPIRIEPTEVESIAVKSTHPIDVCSTASPSAFFSLVQEIKTDSDPIKAVPRSMSSHVDLDELPEFDEF